MNPAVRPSLLLLALAACARPALAQAGAGSSPFTLDAAVERALEVSARVDALEARLRSAVAGASEARSQRQPIVGARASYARLSHVPELIVVPPVGAATTIFPDMPNRYEASLDLDLPLLTGGRAAARVAAAEGTAEAARADVEALRGDVVLEVRRAYWELVGAEETERVLREALVSYEAHLRETRARRDVGLAAENDVLAVQVDRDRAELGRIEAGGTAAVARARLARLLDLPAGQSVDAIEPLVEPAGASGATGDLVAEAWSRRAERAALASRVGAAEAAVGIESASRRPQVGLGASYVYANPNLRVLPLDATWEDTWHVGVGASLRLFDGGRTQHGVARAQADVDVLRADLVDLDRRIRLDVTAAKETLDAARAGIPTADRGLEAARENRRVAADRYREGVIPSSELLDAETGLLLAGLQRTNTLVRAQIAGAALERALGR